MTKTKNLKIACNSFQIWQVEGKEINHDYYLLLSNSSFPFSCLSLFHCSMQHCKMNSSQKNIQYGLDAWKIPSFLFILVADGIGRHQGGAEHLDRIDDDDDDDGEV